MDRVRTFVYMVVMCAAFADSASVGGEGFALYPHCYSEPAFHDAVTAPMYVCIS